MFDSNGVIIPADITPTCYPIWKGAGCLSSRCKASSVVISPNFCGCDPAYSGIDSHHITAQTNVTYLVSTDPSRPGTGGSLADYLTVCYTGCSVYFSGIAYTTCGPPGANGITNGIASSCVPSDSISYDGTTVLKQTSYCACGTGFNYAAITSTDSDSQSSLHLPTSDPWGTCSSYCPSGFPSGYTFSQWCSAVTCPGSWDCGTQGSGGCGVSTALTPGSCCTSNGANPCSATATTTIPTTAVPSTATSNATTVGVTTLMATTSPAATTIAGTTSNATTVSVPTTATAATTTTITPTTPVATTAQPTTTAPTTHSATTTNSTATTASPSSSSAGLSTVTIGIIAGAGGVGALVVAGVVYFFFKGAAVTVVSAAAV